MRTRSLRALAGGVLAATVLTPAGARQLATLAPSQDTTLFEEGDLANGAGQHLFTGTTARQLARRALLRFDVSAALPPGVEILSVELRADVDRTIVGDTPVAVHRLSASWDEGVTDAPGAEGMGAPAAPGDATWSHRLYPAELWASAGGDFASTPSATVVVGFEGAVTWPSTPGMVADVQGWLDDPASNHGWILIGDESTAPTAKRWTSREGPAGSGPELVVTYGPPPIPGLDGWGLSAIVLLLATAGWWVLGRRR